MATNLTIPVKPKKSVVAGKAPLTTDLEPGEISINFADRIIYGKSPSGGIVQLGGGGGVTSYNDLTDLPTLGTAAATASTDYATAAQGAKADSAIQPSPLDFAPVQTIRVLTQTEYDALSPKDQNTLYFIK